MTTIEALYLTGSVTAFILFAIVLGFASLEWYRDNH